MRSGGGVWACHEGGPIMENLDTWQKVSTCEENGKTMQFFLAEERSYKKYYPNSSSKLDGR